jgi:hypothetical protein
MERKTHQQQEHFLHATIPCQLTIEKRLAYLHTSAHRIRWPNPFRPNCIYFTELLDVDDVNPPPHDFVQAGVCGLEAGLDVA